MKSVTVLGQPPDSSGPAEDTTTQEGINSSVVSSEQNEPQQEPLIRPRPSG